MDSLDKKRRALAKHAGRALGLNADIPRFLVSQQQAARGEAEILALPVDYRYHTDLQDLDSASPTFGQPVFMVGFSAVGGPDPIA